MSRNLLTYPYSATSTSVAINGVTWTINEDGSIILNGTSTATVNIFFRPINAFMLPAGKYRIGNGNPNAKGYMLIGAEQSEWSGQIIGNTEFEKTVYGTVGYCLYQIPKGNTFDNVTIYPSLECIMTTSEMLVEVAKGTQKVYEAGYNKGNTEGYTNGYADGEFYGYNNGFSAGYSKAEYDNYDVFWDAFQQNGNRKYYPYAFSFGWNDTSFSPKHPLINLSQVTYMFFNSEITNVNVDIGINGIRADAMFSQCKQLQTIKKLIVDENTTFASNSFYQCEALENITIEGTIASDIDLQYSTKLSRVSIESVVSHLSDSDNVRGKSVIFSHEAVGNAFAYDFGGAWSEFIATKPNWTISFM